MGRSQALQNQHATTVMDVQGIVFFGSLLSAMIKKQCSLYSLNDLVYGLSKRIFDVWTYWRVKSVGGLKYGY